MKFNDEILNGIDQKDFENIARMITEHLCGEKYESIQLKEKALLKNLFRKIQKDGINHAQFNELLLLLNQDRVSKAFFEFFFGYNKVRLHELKKGIVKFRGFAMLCFGNFKFAYKELIQKNKTELEESLHPYCQINEVGSKFKYRPTKALATEEIKKDNTWYTGFLSKKKYEKEAELLKKILKAGSTGYLGLSKGELFSLSDSYNKIGEEIKEVEKIAIRNTDVYLICDYMDVYVATSMRQRWEFEATFDFIRKVFSDKRLQNMNLRYFDPTQCQCENRIDKGLIEGLMLKRATCAIYMAQETETMGKDSELAATLAQGKPVIAYVPEIDIDVYSKRIKTYPLDYFRLRFPVLQADEIFNEKNCIKELGQYDLKYAETIKKFTDELDDYYGSHPFSLWSIMEEKYKLGSPFFNGICRILAIAEKYSYEKRASSLKTEHPLSIQVDLKTGVANGLLVVRSPEKCADLLYRILSNTMRFTIKHIGQIDKGVIILEEEISKCPFRVVTDYEKLTNSFWNFYLYPE